MATDEGVSNLVKEYKAIIGQVASVTAGQISPDTDRIENLLVSKGEWTPSAAEHLLRLSKDYGSFMLRNALALSLALEIEDGALEF